MIERVLYTVAVVSAFMSFALVMGFLLALVHYFIETRVVIPSMDPPLDEYELRPDPMTYFYMDTLEAEGRLLLARDREQAA